MYKEQIHNITQWIINRNEFPKKTIMVMSKFLFDDCVEMTRHLPDVAYISIAATEDCAVNVLGDITETEHYLPDGDKVLNLNFDDITEDIHEGEYTYRAMTEEQARQVVDFVEKNLHRHLIIHCRAGKSRSQGVARAIYDCYSDCYEETIYNKLNPCITPNYDVVSKIKKQWRKKHGET